MRKGKKMQAEITNIEGCNRKLKIQIPKEKVAEEYDSLVKKVSAEAKIKGFRKGKAPKDVVKRYYKDALESDLIKRIIPSACEEAIKNFNLDVVGNYMLEDYVFQEGEPLEFVINVEVKPEIDNVNYKDIKVEKKEVEVKEEEVDETIERLRDSHSELKPVEGRAAKEGDSVVFDFSLSLAEDNKELISTRESKATLGRKELIEELEEAFIGMNKEEKKEVSVKYPEDYHQKELAGKEAIFKIKLKEIHEKIMPDLDDEFAKDVGEYNTLEELKKDIREKILKNKEDAALSDAQKELVEKLIEANPISVPKSLVEDEAKSMIKNWENNLKRMGTKISDLNENEVIGFVNEIEKEAEKKVKMSFLAEKIASVEKIEVEEKEVDEEIKKHAEAYKKEFEQLKRDYEKIGVLPYLKKAILEEKVLNFLLGYSNI
ncbi:MAG: trigger factor [Candidatus Schekmanbacteria bacterium]|nr:MAG: trigger factor [Candidatus Schekmanbacteria bacterium]